MTTWFLILGLIYVSALVFAVVKARRGNNTNEDFLMGGGQLGFLVGALTVAATLFSTFTLMGMPDFFRKHGVGAWIFLAITDAAIAFVIVWFSRHLRRRARQHNFKGMAGLMVDCYRHRWAGFLFLAGVFVFMVPYVSIQIRGISVFLNAAFPDTLPMWGWAVLLVGVLLAYSELGGLKAIIYADALQGLILLSVTVFIAWGCVNYFGGMTEMFQTIQETTPALLSTPGPHGLFTPQFLIATFLAFIVIPAVQPQIAVRLVIMENQRATQKMGILLGLFAIVLIFATVPIGMYGAAKYADMPTSDFLVQVLVFDQLPWVAAATGIGLIAAAISTADSQLFALGNELRSVLKGSEERDMKIVRIAIAVFAAVALGVATISGNQFVMLARVGFAGTAIMAPFILAGILSRKAPGVEIIIATALGLVAFLSSVLGLIPGHYAGYRLDLILMVGLSLFALLSVVARGGMGSSDEASANPENSRGVSV